MTKDNTCSRCGGLGKLVEFVHVDGGTCFKCHGTGVIDPNYKPPEETEIRADQLCVGDCVESLGIILSIESTEDKIVEFSPVNIQHYPQLKIGCSGLEVERIYSIGSKFQLKDN